MSSQKDATDSRASENQHELPHKGSRSAAPVAETMVHFEGENLRPRPGEKPTDWINRTGENQEEVEVERERERREGDPEKAQADWLKRWGFNSSEEANEISGLPMVERHAALLELHKKRPREPSDQPEESPSQPPSKKRKTVRFAEQPQVKMIPARSIWEFEFEESELEDSELEDSFSSTNSPRTDRVEGQQRDPVARAKYEYIKLKTEEGRAKRWLEQKASEISPLNPDLRLVTLEQMREDNPSHGTFCTRWLLQKEIKDNSHVPPLTTTERKSTLTVPSHRYDPGEEPFNFRPYEDGNSPSHSSAKTSGTEQAQGLQRKRPASSFDDIDESESEEIRRAKVWLAEKAAKTLPSDTSFTYKDTRVLSLKQMREDNPDEITLWTRWTTQKKMMNEAGNSTSQSSPKRPRVEQTEGPLSKQPASSSDKSHKSEEIRHAKRWLAQKAARTSRRDMLLTHNNTRIFSLEQLQEDNPDKKTLWARWILQEEMDDEMEDTFPERPQTGEERPDTIQPVYLRDNDDVQPEVSHNRGSLPDDLSESEPSVPIIGPGSDTQASSTPKPDLLEAIMKRLEALEKVVPIDIVKRLEALEKVVQERLAPPASQQAFSTIPAEKRGRGRPKKSDITVQDRNCEGSRSSADERSDLGSTQNIETRAKSDRPRRMRQLRTDSKGKGKASDEPESTTLATQEQEPRRKPGRPRKDAQATPTTERAPTLATPAPTTKTQRGRPRKEELSGAGKASKKTIGKKTTKGQKQKEALIASTHKMRTRTQGSGNH